MSVLQRGGPGGDSFLDGGQGLIDGKEAGGDALHIAVHRHDGHVKGDGGNGGGGIGANAGQGAQLRRILRKAAVMDLNHKAGAGMQVAGTGVIAEAGPFREHILQGGGGECLHVGPAFDEALKTGKNRSDGGLLQHDFGQPYRIRVRPFSRRRPPGQGQRADIIPGEQSFSERGDVHLFSGMMICGHAGSNALAPCIWRGASASTPVRR